MADEEQGYRRSPASAGGREGGVLNAAKAAHSVRIYHDSILYTVLFMAPRKIGIRGGERLGMVGRAMRNLLLEDGGTHALP